MTVMMRGEGACHKAGGWRGVAGKPVLGVQTHRARSIGWTSGLDHVKKGQNSLGTEHTGLGDGGAGVQSQLCHVRAVHLGQVALSPCASICASERCGDDQVVGLWRSVRMT